MPSLRFVLLLVLVCTFAVTRASHGLCDPHSSTRFSQARSQQQKNDGDGTAVRPVVRGAAPPVLPPLPLEGTPPEPEHDEPIAQVVVRGRSGTFSRLPPRPEMSPPRRAQRIAELRAIYARDAATWPRPWVDDGVAWRELGLLPEKIPAPPNNPWTKEKAALGKQLFFDPRLSGSGQIACASCHDPDLAWADGRTTSFGHARKPLRRNAPSLLNAGLAAPLFWDGRAANLEDQALQVLLNPDEMRSSKVHVAKLLQRTPEYRAGLARAFEVEQPGIREVAQAIASFERTLVGGRSLWDRFLRGDRKALSDEALLGLDLFRTKARCMNCHHGPTLSDGRLHDLGLSYYGRTLEDLGQYQVTGKPEHVGRFKTPALRNVSNTGPYMHNGLFPLRGVLNLYNAGMPTLLPKPDQVEDPRFPRNKSPHLRPLGLNRQDLDDLAAFLESLAEPRRRVRPPQLPGLHPSEP